MPARAALVEPIPPSPSSGRRAASALAPTVMLAAALLGVAGCGESSEEKLRAYNEALAAVEREKSILVAMENERKRLEGEYEMYALESFIWSGQLVPHAILGFDLSNQYAKNHWLATFIYRKWPWGWIGQIDRLFAVRPELLPWFDRYAGEIYRKRIAARYIGQLKELQDRVTLQQNRVRNAEEYANLLKPQDMP